MGIAEIHTTHPVRESAEAAERFEWVEIFRGIAILEVIFHHVSGRFLRELETGTPVWYSLAGLNRTLHFAVPAFLMLSALALTRSMLHQWDSRRYAANRLQKSLLPYLLWSGIFILYRMREDPTWADWNRVPHLLLWGKSFPHLYFLAVALQLYLILPLVVPLFRKRPSFAAVLFGAVALTLGIYAINRFVCRLPYVGSFVLWYTPAIALGMWLASQSDRLDVLMKKGLPFASIAAASGLAIYLPLAIRALLKLPVDTFIYQLSHWLYSTSVSFLILYVSWRWSRSSLGVAPIQFLGRYSLQIYLIHPIIIRELERTPRFPEPLGFILAFAVYFTLALLLPLLVARAIAWAHVSGWVFGR